jgi:three-Cys-motif partner protein
MAKKNDDFFKEKKPWSEVKDELLGCYFKPYVSKILHTYKPLVYVDCFAGKGKFEDGNPGSPLIALDIINECTGSTTMDTVNIDATFIDLNYAANLTENLKDYSNVHIVSGKYEDNIRKILKDKTGSNVFLYIDPYGIKALQYSLFDGFAKGAFNSIELLINMNSFGFIREACHALSTTFDDKALFDDLVEYSPTTLDASEKSIQELNDIAGGDYWKQIIESYKLGKIDGYEAESAFAEQYCIRLMDSYKYVLNMPLRIEKGQRPKYRLIHATNHRDGCLLMVDNICNRWEALQDIQAGGQLQMWAEDFDNQIVDDEDIDRKIIEHFSQCDRWISLNDAMAVFFMRHGPICSTKTVRDALKNYAKDGRIEVLRNPETKNGKPTRFFTEGKGQAVSVRWLK